MQKFVDDLFETIFSTAHRGSALPLAIKVKHYSTVVNSITVGSVGEVSTKKNNKLEFGYFPGGPSPVWTILRSKLYFLCVQ